MKLIRLLKYTFLIVVAIALVLVAMANRDIVVLELIPIELSTWIGVHYAIELPLFLVVLGGVVIGLLVGFVWEWIRESRHRSEAKTHRRTARQLEREVQSLKGQQNEGKDEILALVDDAGTAR
jgi:uncharacterized integral membrane protein